MVKKKSKIQDIHGKNGAKSPRSSNNYKSKTSNGKSRSPEEARKGKII